MSEQFDASRPIYAQLVERLKARILAGTYPPGGHLDSVRDLAAAAGVNPNTMQRALAQLESEGLVRTERTSGRYVTEDTNLIEQLRAAAAHDIRYEECSKARYEYLYRSCKYSRERHREYDSDKCFYLSCPQIV